MKKLILGIALCAITSSAHAIEVILQSLQQGGTAGASVAFTDGTGGGGGLGTTSTATWDWDGTTLTSMGLLSAAYQINVFNSLFVHETNELAINTATGTATANDYTCLEGSFGALVGAHLCGNYNFGANFINESTSTWGPGLAVSQTIGGDDVSIGPQQSISSTYDWDTVTLLSGAATTSPGAVVYIGNGFGLGSNESSGMAFQVVPVPAAVWLFGSALGLLGWCGRRMPPANASTR